LLERPASYTGRKDLNDDWNADAARNALSLGGEHVYPWMFEEYGALRCLAEAAHILAEREWPQFYDSQRLSKNEVSAAAAIYAEDMYVEREYSEETANAIRGLRPWITSEYEHDGLRADGVRVLGRLIDLVRGRA
jgi:hypothetical protein